PNKIRVWNLALFDGRQRARLVGCLRAVGSRRSTTLQRAVKPSYAGMKRTPFAERSREESATCGLPRPAQFPLEDRLANRAVPAVAESPRLAPHLFGPEGYGSRVPTWRLHKGTTTAHLSNV